MDREEIKEYLRDNLKIRIKPQYGDYDMSVTGLEVILLLDDEEISRDSTYIS